MKARGYSLRSLRAALARDDRQRASDRQWDADQAMRVQDTPKAKRPRCGARTRKGAPCQAPAVWHPVWNRPRNGRCRLHGGLSTGPQTAEGRARIAASNRRRASGA